MAEIERTDSVQREPSFPQELTAWWRIQPLKSVFLVLLGAWILLFHFLGNSTLGYVNTPSLFGWWRWVYTRGSAEGANWLAQILESDESFPWFVPLIVLGLFWWKRHELQKLPKKIWWPALGLLVVALLLHVAGFVVQQTRISLVGFLVGFYALMGLVWGWLWMRSTFFPWFLLGFCVPISNYIESITLPLRLLATRISVWLCQGALGIDVVRNGTTIWEPTGKFQYEIAAACSGIRSLTAFVAFTTIFSFVFFRKNWKRAIVIGSAFPLAVLSNVVRLLMIIIAAETWGQAAGARVHDSTWISLIPYAPSLVGFVLLAQWLKDDEEEKAA